MCRHESRELSTETPAWVGRRPRCRGTLALLGLLMLEVAACADAPPEVVPIDDCKVVAPETCSRGCQPIVSWANPTMPCARAGVFFGCAPAEGSRFWNRATNLWEGACDIAVADEPDFVYYCFKGRAATYWYAMHAALFCSTTPCDGRIVDDCVSPSRIPR